MGKPKRPQIPKGVWRKRDKLLKKQVLIAQDPRTLEKAEKFHKSVSKVSPEDLLREFTI